MACVCVLTSSMLGLCCSWGAGFSNQMIFVRAGFCRCPDGRGDCAVNCCLSVKSCVVRLWCAMRTRILIADSHCECLACISDLLAFLEISAQAQHMEVLHSTWHTEAQCMPGIGLCTDQHRVPWRVTPRPCSSWYPLSLGTPCPGSCSVHASGRWQRTSIPALPRPWQTSSLHTPLWSHSAVLSSTRQRRSRLHSGAASRGRGASQARRATSATAQLLCRARRWRTRWTTRSTCRSSWRACRTSAASRARR